MSTTNDYVITASSTADLKKEKFDELEVPYITFKYQIDDEFYDDDLFQTISAEEFYQKIKDGAMPKTSQPNAQEYYEFFKPFLEEGKDLLHLTLSSGISGSLNSAMAAAQRLAKEFPDRKIEIVDSLGASSGFGLLVTEASELKKEGKTIEEVKDWLEENKLNLHHWFFSTDLTSYKRGGRISPTAATFGNLLNICPLLNMNDKGELIPRKKIRGKKNVIKALVDKMKEHADNGLDYSGKAYICHSDSIKEAKEVKKLVEEAFPNLDGEVEINDIGGVIGSHTGPGTVALFFNGDKRID